MSKTRIRTIAVEAIVSLREGHVTFFNSIPHFPAENCLDFCYTSLIFLFAAFRNNFFPGRFFGRLGLSGRLSGLELLRATSVPSLTSCSTVALIADPPFAFGRLVTVFLSLPYIALRAQSSADSAQPRNYGLNGLLKMAGQEGFEPPTPGFGDRCSSQLSYWPAVITDLQKMDLVSRWTYVRQNPDSTF